MPAVAQAETLTDAFIAAYRNSNLLDKQAATLRAADEDVAQGHAFSASDKLERASLYLFNAERMQGHGHPGREATFAKAQDAFKRAMRLGDCAFDKLISPIVHDNILTRWRGDAPFRPLA